jgi:hypothetical protein
LEAKGASRMDAIEHMVVAKTKSIFVQNKHVFQIKNI